MVSRAFGCISHFVLVLLIVYLFIYPIIAFVQPVCMLLSQHISGHSLHFIQSSVHPFLDLTIYVYICIVCGTEG